MSAAPPGVTIECPASSWNIAQGQTASWYFNTIQGSITISNITFINSITPIGLYNSVSITVTNSNFFNSSALNASPLQTRLVDTASIIFMAGVTVSSGANAMFTHVTMSGVGFVQPPLLLEAFNFFLADALAQLTVSNCSFAGVSMPFNIWQNGAAFTTANTQVLVQYSNFYNFTFQAFSAASQLTLSTFQYCYFYSPYSGSTLAIQGGIADALTVQFCTFIVPGGAVQVPAQATGGGGGGSNYIGVLNCTFIPLNMNQIGPVYISSVQSVSIYGCMFDFSQSLLSSNTPSTQFLGASSAVYLSSQGMIVVSHCTFKNLVAYQMQSPVMQVYGSSGSLSVVGTVFTNMYLSPASNPSSPVICAAFSIDSSSVSARVVSSTFNNIQMLGSNAAALYSNGVLLVSLNNNFINNTALSSVGAALSVTSGSISMIGCNFISNQAAFGALNIGGTAGEVYNSVFTNNFANSAGGAVNLQGSSSITMTGCSFTNNNAVQYGGAINLLSSTLFSSNNLFIGNSAQYGGGVCSQALSVLYDNSNFTGNSAPGGFGGGVYCDTTSTAILGANPLTLSTTCLSSFTSNSAALGGAVYIQGSLSTPSLYAPITNATFSSNQATWGGAAVFAGSNCFPTIAQATAQTLNQVQFTFSSNAASAGGADVLYSNIYAACWTPNGANSSSLHMTELQPGTAAFGPHIATLPVSLSVVDSLSTSYNPISQSFSAFPGQFLSFTFNLFDALLQQVRGSFPLIINLAPVSCTDTKTNTACSSSAFGNNNNTVLYTHFLNSLVSGAASYYDPASGNITIPSLVLFAPQNSFMTLNLTVSVPLGAQLVLWQVFSVSLSSCPSGYRSSVRTAATTGLSVTCIPCEIGQYSLYPDSPSCQTCNPNEGLICSGSQVAASSGYWIYEASEQSVLSVTCPLSVCIGSSKTAATLGFPSPSASSNTNQPLILNQCAPFRDESWPLCGKCLPDFSLWFGSCIRCTSVSIPHIFGFVFIAFGYAIFIYFISYSSTTARSPHMRLWLNFFQVVDIIRSTTVFDTSGAIALANLDLSSILTVSSVCPFPRTSYIALALNVISPLIVLIALVIVIVVMRISFRLAMKHSAAVRDAVEKQKNTDQAQNQFEGVELQGSLESGEQSSSSSSSSSLSSSLLAHDSLSDYAKFDSSAPPSARVTPRTSSSLFKRLFAVFNQKLLEMWIASGSNQSIIRSFVQLSLFAYQRFCGDSFRFFSLIYISGHYYNVTLPEIWTGDGVFSSWSGLFGVTLAISILFPFALLIFLRNSKSLFSATAASSTFNQRYSLLWASFHPDKWYWTGILMLLRMFLLIGNTVGILFQGSFPFLRLVLLAWFLAISWSMQERFQPYMEPAANSLSSMVSAGCIAILGLIAVLEVASSTPSTEVDAKAAYHGTAYTVYATVTIYAFYIIAKSSLKKSPQPQTKSSKQHTIQ